jgi:hypothetical protein
MINYMNLKLNEQKCKEDAQKFLINRVKES